MWNGPFRIGLNILLTPYMPYADGREGSAQPAEAAAVPPVLRHGGGLHLHHAHPRLPAALHHALPLCLAVGRLRCARALSWCHHAASLCGADKLNRGGGLAELGQ